jgi:PilZ domain
METGQKTGVADLLVRVWGMGANGRAFFQNVYARNLTHEGALLSGIDHPLNQGDVIGLQLDDKKARFRVVSIRDAGLPEKIQAEVQIISGQECPWKQFVAAGIAPPPLARPNDKRRYDRLKVRFPVEIRDDRGGGSPMQTNASDISGRGCYVESMVPLPLGTPLTVNFWIGEEKVTTSALVRTSDPGVGMGIEFIGLPSDTEQRFQRMLEKMSEEASATQA